MRTTICLVLAAAALGGCKWTEFDDLAAQTWVSSTGKPNVKSADYGVAIQRGARSAASGGTLVVIGASPALYSELVYTAQGEASLATTTIDLNAQGMVGNLDPQPILLADPSGDDVALIVNGGGSAVNVLTGTNKLDLHALSISPSTVDGATYMQAPNPGNPTVAQPAQPLVASGEVVVGTIYANPPSTPPTCKLVDGTTAIKPLALGAVRNGAFDDVLAWGSNGNLYRYSGSVFNGCLPPLPSPIPLASHDTGFVPGHGSQILSIDATHVLLQGHHDSDDKAVLQVYDATTPAALTPVGGAVSLPNLRAAAILDTGSQKYVIAGYPATVVDGKTGGQVMLFRVSAAGIESTPAATLSDAQPDNNESFGRAVAAMPFNGHEIIVVAADNEIFTYFRVDLTDGTPLYDETRQGR